MRPDPATQRGGKGRHAPQNDVAPGDRLSWWNPRFDLAPHASGDRDVLAGHRCARGVGFGDPSWGGAGVLLSEGGHELHGDSRVHSEENDADPSHENHLVSGILESRATG
jgi:hypothetical protein